MFGRRYGSECNALSTPERLLGPNVFVIDCPHLDSRTTGYLKKFMETFPKIRCRITSIRCLHGKLSTDNLTAYQFCTNPGDYSKIEPIQLVVRHLITFPNLIVHVISSKGFNVTPNFVMSWNMHRKIFVWTDVSRLQGDSYDIRRRYWWNVDKMHARYIQDLHKYWTNEEHHPPYLLESMGYSIWAGILSGLERITPETWA